LLRDWAIYLAAATVLLWSGSPLLWVPAWVVAAAAISGLFVIGHDAAHGALFRSVRLNYWVAQLAMLPSLHAFDVWAYGHNRIHHPFAACQGMDFVWHPTTAGQYRRLSRFGKVLHRLEWSMFGAGLYYARAMWWGRIINAVPPPRLQRAFRRDRYLISAYALTISLAVGGAGYALNGHLLGAVWCWTRVPFCAVGHVELRHRHHRLHPPHCSGFAARRSNAPASITGGDEAPLGADLNDPDTLAIAPALPFPAEEVVTARSAASVCCEWVRYP
jgi:fatty acid desaturase